jgi:pSer/pThr/pTyr-binding forkhead associated (FHA) protein
MLISQLQSVHLSGNPRRQAFREARDRLRHACGAQTILVQNGITMNPSAQPTLAGQKDVPAESLYVLVDGELVYPLKPGINTVGRFLDSDVFLCERHISRRHCVILVHTNGTCDLHDTASRNGTLLNGQSLAHPVPLRSGDRIRIVDREFTFLSVADFQMKRITAIDSDTWHG